MDMSGVHGALVRETSCVTSGSGCRAGTSGVQPTPEKTDNRRSKRARSTESSSEGENSLEPEPCPATCPAPIRAWLSSFAKQTVCWLQALGNLHPACLNIPGDAVVRLTLAVFRIHIQRRGPEAGHPLRAVAAASFWVAIKFIAARNTMPNASFLGHVTGVAKADLLPAELAVLESHSFDIYAAARAVGMVPLPDDLC